MATVELRLSTQLGQYHS